MGNLEEGNFIDFVTWHFACMFSVLEINSIEVILSLHFRDGVNNLKL